MKEIDQDHCEEINEYDEYIEQLEDECCQMQVRMEKMESYIDDLKDQVEELSTENKSLESQV